MEIKKTFESISDKANNFEIEREFREACSIYESQSSAPDQSLAQNYQKYISDYHKITSLYLTEVEKNQTKLIIYDTETEREEVKILDTPEPLNLATCITKLPDNELFCFGNFPCSGIALIIDSNYSFRLLPSGTQCWSQSGIYFNNNVYCFGGYNYDQGDFDLSRKFDLNQSRWTNLASMPKPDSSCHCAVFNGNVLISGCLNKSLLLYSIDIDSFSTIPYDFAYNVRKILIGVDKLYLIECGWKASIYESEDEYSWKPISKSIINFDYPDQAYCSYNKGGIYIITTLEQKYYKFDLSQRIMIKI